MNASPTLNPNPGDSFSPSSSSLNTLSPPSSTSISSPDKSHLLNQTINDEKAQTFRLIDYFVVTGLEKSAPVEPSVELADATRGGSAEQILNPFQCSYRCRVLGHFPNEVENNPFDEDAISRVSETSLKFRARRTIDGTFV